MSGKFVVVVADLLKNFPWILVKEARQGKYLYTQKKSMHVLLFHTQNTSSPEVFISI